MAPGIVYDEIGGSYSAYRRPDARIMSQVLAALGDAATVVNVGAGTGSYEPNDRSVVAVEPSAVMIRQRARLAAPAIQAAAEALPFPDHAFDAALAVLTVHHWPDPEAGLAELRRVAARGVVLTFDPEVHNNFWLLREYVPAAATLESARPITLGAIAAAIGATRIETVPVPHDCVDGFGWAYWRRPERYLDPAARSCISMLAALDRAEVDAGMNRLAADLASGAWYERHADLLDLDEIDGGFRLLIGA